MVITGKLSGRPIHVPDPPAGGMPSLAEPGVILDGRAAPGFGTVAGARTYPDMRSARLKIGLLIPATNTSAEADLWGVLRGDGGRALAGVGVHATNVLTPRPVLATASDLAEYRQQFLDGLRAAVDTALLAQPDMLIMGMSLEHILSGLDLVREPARAVEAQSGLWCATWHEAVDAALGKFGAHRIGLLTPFDRDGNASASRLFEDLGYDVVASVGFSCAHALHIAHIPDWAKERAILELLATDANRLDAIVQCGTNMSVAGLVTRVEPLIGIPLLGINLTTLWYALRELGIDARVEHAGRLFAEC